VTTGDKHQIYGLIDPEERRVGYFGVTTQGVARRLIEHVSETKLGRGSRRKHTWLGGMLDAGLEPHIVEFPLPPGLGIRAVTASDG
jgi:hypothetical protein